MTKSATERAEAQQWAEYVQYLENEVERLNDRVATLVELRKFDQAEIERLTRDLEIWRRNGGDDLLLAEIDLLRLQLNAYREPKP